jgi:subtilase family serine protease
MTAEQDTEENSTENQTATEETEIIPAQPPVQEKEIQTEKPDSAVLPWSGSSVYGIDLVVQDIKTTDKGCLNAAFPITTTIANQGNMEAGAFSLHYYLSEDSIISTSDRDIGSDMVEGLAPMENRTINGEISLPTSIPIKYYSVGVIIDPRDDVFESDKQNNHGKFSQRIQITECQPEN